jgi:hypothetical protein
MAVGAVKPSLLCPNREPNPSTPLPNPQLRHYADYPIPPHERKYYIIIHLKGLHGVRAFQK